MKLENVVPFGRSLDEYRRMSLLTGADLDKRIVGIGDGPASFNAEMLALGKSVVSVDPLYVFDAEEIEKQFFSVVDDLVAKMKVTPDDWVWSYLESAEHMKEHRINVLRRFLADYEPGRAEGRYVVGELPKLDFETGQFDAAICSHLLFLYSDHFTYEFHLESILEMLRVASDVRIYPLLTLMIERSSYVRLLTEELESFGFVVRVEKVGYEFQKGANEMLRIQKAV
jgi:hypothetical protein